MKRTVTRASSPEDLDAVRDLVRAFFAWAMAQVEDEGPPGGCLILARLDGAPVGCVGSRALGAGTMEVKRMFVHPEAWGNAVGGAMLDALLAEARAAGHSRAILSMHKDLHAAQALCARAGFMIVPPTDEFPGVQPDIEICMALPLDSTGAAA